MLNRLAQSALRSLRMKLSQQILGSSLRTLETLGPARLLTVLTEDLPQIAATILLLPTVAMNATIAVGCLIYMGTVSVPLLMIFAVLIALGILSYRYPARRAQAVLQKARDEADIIAEQFRALTYGAKELKLHEARRHSFLTDVLLVAATSAEEYNLLGMRIYTAAASWAQVAIFVIIGIIIFFHPTLPSHDIGALTSFIIALLYLTTPLQVIVNMIPSLGHANVALQNIQSIGLTLSASEQVPSSLEKLAPFGWRVIEFSSITHEYGDENERQGFTLGPLTLRFLPGVITFIVGGNGSGKTTFAKLLTGLYTPQSGEIRIDQTPIKTAAALEAYRQLFSTVFSDAFLFDRLLGLNSDQVEARSTEYLQRLQLAPRVHIDNGRLSTLDVSQGQRKRLALLTAFLEDRQIYIFDEWAADQDPGFREIFYLELIPELKARGKTVFVISHDDRYFHIADRLIKLEEGSVVEDSKGIQDLSAREASA